MIALLCGLQGQGPLWSDPEVTYSASSVLCIWAESKGAGGGRIFQVFQVTLGKKTCEKGRWDQPKCQSGLTWAGLGKQWIKPLLWMSASHMGEVK